MLDQNKHSRGQTLEFRILRLKEGIAVQVAASGGFNAATNSVSTEYAQDGWQNSSLPSSTACALCCTRLMMSQSESKHKVWFVCSEAIYQMADGE